MGAIVIRDTAYDPDTGMLGNAERYLARQQKILDTFHKADREACSSEAKHVLVQTAIADLGTLGVAAGDAIRMIFPEPKRR